MRTLILGASGLLGRNWISQMVSTSEILALIHKNDFNNKQIVKIYERNIFDKSFYDKISKYSPSVILNFLAYTNVDNCEKNFDIANNINHLFPEQISKYAKKNSIKLVHISTDQLFDGKKENYTEADDYSPLNNYAYTKMMAEKKILSNNSDSLIIRTNFFCKGLRHRSTLSDFILSSCKNKLEISLFNDVMYNPVNVSELINIINLLLIKNASGIFNVCSNEVISKYDFGIILAKKMNIKNYFIKSELKNSKLIAERPLNMSLLNDKLLNFLNIKIPHINEQILKLSKNYL
jgi:dTDP-4-dehydrorhamnose reductase